MHIFDFINEFTFLHLTREYLIEVENSCKNIKISYSYFLIKINGFIICVLLLVGNRVGDVCESDLDKDGVLNNLDICPKNKDISSINFTEYTSIDLNPTLTSEKAAVWHIMDKGREVRQMETTLKPAAYIGGLVVLIDHIEFD